MVREMHKHVEETGFSPTSFLHNKNPAEITAVIQRIPLFTQTCHSLQMEGQCNYIILLAAISSTVKLLCIFYLIQGDQSPCYSLTNPRLFAALLPTLQLPMYIRPYTEYALMMLINVKLAINSFS